MGLFSKKVAYPELAQDTPVARQIAEVEAPLAELAGKVSDPLEIVSANNHAYVFIGKPPKKFGLAVLEENKFESFVSVAKGKGLSDSKIVSIIEELGDAYREEQNSERFKKTIAGKDIVVLASQKLERQVTQIIQAV